MAGEKSPENEISLTEKVLKGSLTAVVLTSLTSPFGYLIKVLYSQTLSIEMFGLFYAMHAFFFLISSYKGLGFGYSLKLLVPKYYRKKDYKACWQLYKYDQIIEVGISIAVSVLLFVFSDWIATHYFKNPQAKVLISVFIIFLISGSFLSALEKFFIGLQQEKYYSSINSSRLLFSLAFSFIVWILDVPNVVNYAIAWAIANILLAIIYELILKKKYSYLPRSLEWNEKLFRSMFKYAVPSLLTSTAITLTTSVNNIFLTIFNDVKDVGVYNVVLPLASIATIVLTPINNLIFPLVSEYMERDNKVVKKLINMGLMIVPFIGFYFALFISIFPIQPIQYLFGEKWIDMAKSPLVVLSFAFIFIVISNFLSVIVAGMGKMNEYLKASTITAVVSITATYSLVNRYSVLGVAAATIIAYSISTVLYAKILNKTISFKFPLIYYIKLILFGVVLYVIVSYFDLEPSSLFQYIMYGIVYSSVVVMFAYYLHILDIDMLKLLAKKS